jgi:hypothetical protein
MMTVGFVRVQCKTGRLAKGAISFPTAIWCRGNKYRSYSGDVDCFGVYCSGTGQVYLVPVADVPDRSASLRFDPPRNRQSKGVRWAKDYAIWPAQSDIAGTGLARLGAAAEAA